MVEYDFTALSEHAGDGYKTLAQTYDCFDGSTARVKKLLSSPLMGKVGTTGVFVCMGKPVPNFLTGEYNKKIMPLGIVMDERICTGHEYALFWQTLRRYLKHPELTENGAEERAEMPEAVEA